MLKVLFFGFCNFNEFFFKFLLWKFRAAVLLALIGFVLVSVCLPEGIPTEFWISFSIVCAIIYALFMFVYFMFAVLRFMLDPGYHAEILKQMR